MSTVTATLRLENPFPGLRPFKLGEEHLFFGRENQVDKMLDKLAANHFLSVVGTSGSGKSSLVTCGLLPALHRGMMVTAGSAWCVVQMRPGGDPVGSMARAFSRESRFTANIPPVSLSLANMLELTLRMSSLGIAELFEYGHFKPGTNLLVFVDQFEELFRYQRAVDGSDTAFGVSGRAVGFVNLLLEARAQTIYPIFVAMTMRSDFLGECSQFDGLPEVINEGQYLVPRLTREERRQAIAGPIAVWGAEVSPVLLTRVVNDVGNNPDQLSIMQHAMNRTWAYWRKEGRSEGPLLLQHYDNETVGSMARALDLHANEAYSELKTERALKICERVFKALTDRGTDPRGIRRPLQFERLCKIVGAGQEEVSPVLDVFRQPSRAFLMPPWGEPLEPNTVIDISHEILMRVWMRLKAWADEEAKSAATYRHIAETAERHQAKEAGLWGDPDKPDLKTALEWKRRQEPNEEWSSLYRSGFHAGMEFLEASKRVCDEKIANAELERRWRHTGRPILIGIAALVFVFFSQKFMEMISPQFHKVAHKFFNTATNTLPPQEQEVERRVETAIQPTISQQNSTEKKAEAAPRTKIPHSAPPLLSQGNRNSAGTGSGSPTPSESLKKVSATLADIFGVQLFAVVCLVGYLGLAVAGKRMYRRVAFAGILEEVSAPPKPTEALSETETHAISQTGTNGVTLEAASFWRILLAGIIDSILVLFLIVLAVFISLLISELDGTPNWYFAIVYLFFYVSWLLVPWLYGSLMTSSRLGGTLGDLTLGIRLNDMSGNKPKFKRALGRYSATSVSWILFGLGFLLQLYRPARRSLHDRIAGTIVVRHRKSRPVPEPNLAIAK